MIRPWLITHREWELRGGWEAERRLRFEARFRALVLVLGAVALVGLAIGVGTADPLLERAIASHGRSLSWPQ